MSRLGPRGADLDEYAKQQWAPLSMRKVGVVLECLLTCGCPVLIGHCPYGFRSAMCDLPVYGMGKFNLGIAWKLCYVYLAHEHGCWDGISAT